MPQSSKFCSTSLVFLLFIMTLNEVNCKALRNMKSEDKGIDLSKRRRLEAMDQFLADATSVRQDADELKPFYEAPRLGVPMDIDMYIEDEEDSGNKDKKDKKDKKKNKNKENKDPVEEAGDRIIGGTDAVEAYNYFAMLIDNTSTGNFWTGCGATLIAPDILLTAAHCVEGREEKVDFAYVNAYAPWLGNMGNVPAFRRVTDRIVHPNYSSIPSPPHDMAILKLNVPVTDFPPVKLPEITNADYTGKSFTIMGFGHTSYPDDQDPPKILQEAEVNFVPDKVCDYLYNKANLPGINVDDSMLCATGTNYKIDACQGDSGGPMIMVDDDGEDVLVGVTSWGYGCAVNGYPGVYSSTAKALHWIHDMICQHTSDPENWCKEIPTEAPTEALTASPTAKPTSAPTEAPTLTPITLPTSSEKESPVAVLTEAPTRSPTKKPTKAPTEAPKEKDDKNDKNDKEECVDIDGKFFYSVEAKIKMHDCNQKDISKYCDFKALWRNKSTPIEELCPTRCGCSD